jgi:acetyl-CoA acetyltransferase family protein
VKFTDVAVPIGLAWSSPFCRWQGPLAEMSSIDLAVDVAGRALRRTDPNAITYLAVGTTVPQPTGFYGATTIAPRLGLDTITGPTIAQACATSAAVVQAAAAQVQLGAHQATLALATDRTSNGPLMVYSSQQAPGAAPITEHWVLDPMRLDPNTRHSMVDTAEFVAAEAGLSRSQIDDLTLLRYEQYAAAVAGGVSKRYLVEVHVPGRKGVTVIAEDVGIHPTTAEGLARLTPSTADGVVTFGSQTHPGDGTAGVVVSRTDVARDLSNGSGVARILAVSFARVERARMPKAPVPAARAALADAGLDITDIDVVTTHNPFAVNDLYFARETGFALERMNPYGSSLIYGHPQSPTGLRAITELIQALHDRGGGRGLFTGCAAGDTAGAVVVEVTA